MKILIVDENATNSKILTMFLCKNGYDAKTASSLESALNKLSNSTDLILIDTNLSENGYEVCNQIKKQYENIPVILISRDSKTDDVVKAFSSGAGDYITVPFKSDELLKKIETQLKIKELQDNHLDEEAKKLTGVQLETLFSLAKQAQSKDDDTGRHIERVKKYCKLLAQELTKPIYKQSITPEFIKNIELASTLHDIGKVGIADNIVLKPDKLTDKEFEEMKKHTTIGYDMLKNVDEHFNGNNFIKMAMNIAHYHHERYDGKGYPQGLSKQEIPLEARIVAVADVYDALRTQKPYHDALSHEKAFEVIKGGRELQFDYLIVKALKKVHHDFDKIWNEMQD